MEIFPGYYSSHNPRIEGELAEKRKAPSVGHMALVFEKMVEMMAETDGGEGTSSKQLFSLHAMRQRRITRLPSRFARKDADDIVAQLEFPSRETIDQQTPEKR